MTDDGADVSLPPVEAARFAETRAARACSLITFALVILFSFVVLHSLMVGAERFVRMFEEMRTELPGVTILVLALRPVATPLVFLAAIASVVKEFAVKNHLATLIANGVHLVLLVAMRELVHLAMSLPLFIIMDSLGGG